MRFTRKDRIYLHEAVELLHQRYREGRDDEKKEVAYLSRLYKKVNNIQDYQLVKS